MSSFITRSHTESIVLITGSNTGLGFATAQALLSSPEVYTLILTSRSLVKAEAAAEVLKHSSDHNKESQVVPMQLDIDDDESVKALFSVVSETWGRMDVLVNNAGPFASTAPALAHPPHTRS